MIKLFNSNSKEKLKDFDENTFHSVVTDPPYELGFMGKEWDKSGIAFDVDFWSEVLRVLKPGGHLLSFGGNRTHHRMMVAVEDAGFEIRDCLMWIFLNGFPKSLDMSKAIDKHYGKEDDREVVGSYTKTESHTKEYAGETRDDNPWGQVEIPITEPATEDAKKWDGWGSNLKPSYEPVVLARKPLSEDNIAQNVLKHGVGALNINGCKIGDEIRYNDAAGNKEGGNSLNMSKDGMPEDVEGSYTTGRWPTNFIPGEATMGDLDWQTGDKNASKFFYSPKAQRDERNIGCEGNDHPTVKPVELMSYLVRLVTPEDGRVLDPFMGSGSTGMAAVLERRKFVGIEKDLHKFEISDKRINYTQENYQKVYDFIFDDPSNDITKKEKSSINHDFW